MSVQATTWVWEDSSSKGTDRLVLLAIADAANREGEESCQSATTLAEMAQVSERTVWRSLSSLTALGELERTGESAKYKTAIYRLPGMGKTAPDKTSPPDKSGDRPLTPKVSTPDMDGTLPHLTPSTNVDTPSNVRPPAAPSSAEVRNASKEVTALAERLYWFISRNLGREKTHGKRDLDQCRLMLDADGRDAREAWELIKWCQDDGFWMTNILSMTKFRAQYDKLLLQSKRKSSGGSRQEKHLDLIAQAEADEAAAEERRVQREAAWEADWGAAQFALPAGEGDILDEEPHGGLNDRREGTE